MTRTEYAQSRADAALEDEPDVRDRDGYLTDYGETQDHGWYLQGLAEWDEAFAIGQAAYTAASGDAEDKTEAAWCAMAAHDADLADSMYGVVFGEVVA